MNVIERKIVIANGREYHFPKASTVIVYIDGSEPGYIEAAIKGVSGRSNSRA